jgi:hypothetical protein
LVSNCSPLNSPNITNRTLCSSGTSLDLIDDSTPVFIVLARAPGPTAWRRSGLRWLLHCWLQLYAGLRRRGIITPFSIATPLAWTQLSDDPDWAGRSAAHRAHSLEYVHKSTHGRAPNYSRTRRDPSLKFAEVPSISSGSRRACDGVSE